MGVVGVWVGVLILILLLMVILSHVSTSFS